jgi:hypothetical protein
MTTDVERLWVDALRESREASAARRERVFAHRDLVDKLRQPPLALTEPNRWSGWIPPKTLPEDVCPGCRGNVRRPACDGLDHHARANDSPRRRQLVDIAAEAMRREADAA